MKATVITVISFQEQIISFSYLLLTDSHPLSTEQNYGHRILILQVDMSFPVIHR